MSQSNSLIPGPGAYEDEYSKVKKSMPKPIIGSASRD